MNKNELLAKAVTISAEAHKEQRDKTGHPYLGHVFRVMNMGRTADEKICGALHDVVEDTGWTFEKLEREGFPPAIVEAIKCLTKVNEEEDYEDFINRITKNRLAVSVKIYDLADNLDVKRFTEMTEKDLKRVNKYLKAYHLLTEMQTN